LRPKESLFKRKGKRVREEEHNQLDHDLIIFAISDEVGEEASIING